MVLPWHRFEDAIAQSLRTIEIAPNHFFAHWILGITYGQTGKYEEAIEELQKAASLTEGNQAISADLARVYAQTGRHDHDALLFSGDGQRVDDLGRPSRIRRPLISGHTQLSSIARTDLGLSP